MNVHGHSIDVDSGRLQRDLSARREGSDWTGRVADDDLLGLVVQFDFVTGLGGNRHLGRARGVVEGQRAVLPRLQHPNVVGLGGGLWRGGSAVPEGPDDVRVFELAGAEGDEYLRTHLRQDLEPVPLIGIRRTQGRPGAYVLI